MADFLTLNQLNKNLTDAISQGSLLLIKSLLDSGNLIDFLETLPQQQLLINNVKILLADKQLTVIGDIQEKWGVKGLNKKQLSNINLSLIFTEIQPNTPLSAKLGITGQISINQKNIIIVGDLKENSNLEFSLAQQSLQTFQIQEIADFSTNSHLVNFIPLGEELFNSVLIKDLSLEFGFKNELPTLININSETSTKDWEVIPEIITLKNMGIVIQSKYNFIGNELSLVFGGNIYATLNIGQDYQISIPFQDGNLWIITIIPNQGNVLPGLLDLAHFIGKDSLKNSVENGLNNLDLGAISIDDITIAFDLNLKKIIYVSLLSSITFLGARINLYTQLPDFQFAGSLDRNSNISLKALIEHYFAKADDFPELDITELSLTAYPSESLYSIHTIIQDVWDFKIASSSIAIAELELELTKSGNSISGSITASLMVVDVSVFIIAKSPENRGNGWQFEGKTATGNEIHLGRLINELARKFGTDTTLPSSVSDLIIENIGVSFNTKTKDFTFTCESQFPIDHQNIDITVNINILRQLDLSYKKHFDGHITIGSLKFALIFDTDQTSTKFLAAYHDDQTVKVKDLIGYIDSQLKEDIPEGLEIRLKDALFAYSKQQTLTNFLFGLNIDGGINLSNLPLVGREFPPNETLKISLQVLVTKANFTAPELQTLNTLYTDGGIKLPTTDINQRLDLIPSLQFGSEIQQLELPITINKQTGQIEGTTPPRDNNLSPPVVTPSSTPTPISDSTKWFTLQKSLGPVHFQRIGLKYQDSKIWVLLDASLNLAGLSLSLDGLGVNSPLNQFDPKFDLKGIGIDYKGSDTLEIGGAFLRTTRNGIDEYDGAAVIKFNVKGKALKLSAIGSYAYFEGHPSLFIYALLDYPIGGPSFFFVTGLAAGFGYNRALKVPTIDQVATFPLVAEAVNPPPAEGSNSDQAARLTGELTKLRDYIPPETGQIFLAIGVKFNSFKTIDAFVLLTIAFGNRFELNILGLATLIAPANVGADVTPVAEVQLALKASFLPAEGFLGIIAQLTPNSYILSKACHLTGGFAFYGWFAPNVHEGDFVLTLGGYHPLFKVPDHYPKVPRLTLNWQVSSELYIKADAYFALTPSAIMAGGHLQATWNSGPLSAWFNAGADFLMSWKPYHYDISIYIDMGVSYTFHFFGTHHITVQLGADLHIW